MVARAQACVHSAACSPPCHSRKHCNSRRGPTGAACFHLHLAPTCAAAVWELVAGEEVHENLSAFQIILAVTQHGYRPPIPPHCPPRLEALMKRCWAEDPKERWVGLGQEPFWEDLACSPLQLGLGRSTLEDLGRVSCGRGSAHWQCQQAVLP